MVGNLRRAASLEAHGAVGALHRAARGNILVALAVRGVEVPAQVGRMTNEQLASILADLVEVVATLDKHCERRAEAVRHPGVGVTGAEHVALRDKLRDIRDRLHGAAIVRAERAGSPYDLSRRPTRRRGA